MAAAVAYSASFYLKNRTSANEPFDPIKFFATLIVGIGISLLMLLSHVPLTEQDVFTQLVAYAGMIALVETLLKSVLQPSVKTSSMLTGVALVLASILGERQPAPTPSPPTATPTPEGVPMPTVAWQPAEVWQDDEQTYKLVDAQITDLTVACSKPVPMEIINGFSQKQIGFRGRILKPDGTPETRTCTVVLNMISPDNAHPQELQVKTDPDGRFEAWGYYWIPHNFTFSPDVKTWPGATCVLVYGSGWGGQNRVYRGFIKGFTIQFTG
jgi:hypothetical protein